MLDAVISLQFNTVETIWRHFWRSANNNEAVDVGMEEDPEKILPKYVEGKIYRAVISCVLLLVREREKRRGPDGRAANSLKHKNFDDDNVIYLFFFSFFFFFGLLWFGVSSLIFPQG